MSTEKSCFFTRFAQLIFRDTDTCRRIDQRAEESEGDGLAIQLDHLIQKSGGLGSGKGGFCGHAGLRGGGFQRTRSNGVNSSPP